jgi:uncharacterized protein (TIGR00255 family)
MQDSIRSAIQKHVVRGKADVFISYYKNAEDTNSLEVDYNLASSYVKVAKSLKKQFPSLKNDFTITSLMKVSDVVRSSQEEQNVEELLPILVETVENACKNLNTMREFEGEKLKLDMLSRIDTIEQTVLEIKERAPLVAAEYSKKLFDRIETVMQDKDYDEARLLQEVAIFTDKSNIDEELTRLTSHISQFRKICAQGGEVGKKLDFLVQEFNRESNTVCSKSNDIVVTDNALKLKCEIEKIREQIQNVE